MKDSSASAKEKKKSKTKKKKQREEVDDKDDLKQTTTPVAATVDSSTPGNDPFSSSLLDAWLDSPTGDPLVRFTVVTMVTVGGMVISI